MKMVTLETNLIFVLIRTSLNICYNLHKNVYPRKKFDFHINLYELKHLLQITEKYLLLKEICFGWIIFRMDLGETGWGGVDWISLAQDGNRWRALVNAVMNVRVP
jgi:hypothetical protein